MGYVAYVLHCKKISPPESKIIHVTVISFNSAVFLDEYLKKGATKYPIFEYS
jgi:hypothetical protein